MNHDLALGLATLGGLLGGIALVVTLTLWYLNKR